MPHDLLRPIDTLNTDWRRATAGRPGRAAWRALAAREPDLADLDVGDLGELLALMRRAQGRDERERAAAVVRALLRSQDAHPLLPRAILQALVPGLVGVARRLSWGQGGEWTDGAVFFADLIATTWEVIVSWAGEDRPYAVLDLLSAVRCRLRRELLRHKALRERVEVGLDPDDQWATGDPDAGSTDLERLARAIDDLTGRGLDRADAAVVYANRVLGQPLSELARTSGRSRRHLSGCRDRAERVLCA